jgi:HSP20 family molecular chaperone IbpA
MKRRDEIDRLHEEIKELVDELWHLPRFAGGARRGFRPQADCIRSEEPPTLHVVIELPGVDPASINVVAADRMLVVAGERRPPISGRYHQLEIEYGPFQRRIPLDEAVDTEAASARYESGMLIVELPIAPEPPKGERVAITIRGRA